MTGWKTVKKLYENRSGLRSLNCVMITAMLVAVVVVMMMMMMMMMMTTMMMTTTTASVVAATTILPFVLFCSNYNSYLNIFHSFPIAFHLFIFLLYLRYIFLYISNFLHYSLLLYDEDCHLAKEQMNADTVQEFGGIRLISTAFRINISAELEQWTSRWGRTNTNNIWRENRVKENYKIFL